MQILQERKHLGYLTKQFLKDNITIHTQMRCHMNLGES